MTDPTIHEIQRDVNTRIAAFGEEIAREMLPEVAELLKESLEHDDGAQAQYGDALHRDIIVPALCWHSLLHLSNALENQSRGWADVFFKNLRDYHTQQRERP